MTDFKNNITNSNVQYFRYDRESVTNKSGFERAVNGGVVQNTGNKKVAFAIAVVPLWIGAIACVAGGAWALDNIRKILFGEPRTKGTPAQESLLGQSMNSIKDDSRFSTLPSSVQANVLKAETGNSDNKKKIVVKGNSSTARLRRKGPNRPPKKDSKDNVVSNTQDDKGNFSIPRMWTSNSLKDLPIKLYREVCAWIERASVKNPFDHIDVINIGRTPKANPLNPTNVSSMNEIQTAPDGFVKFQRTLLDGEKIDFFLKITTNGRAKFINASELLEVLNAKLPH